jgi:hypothetical protein
VATASRAVRFFHGAMGVSLGNTKLAGSGVDAAFVTVSFTICPFRFFNRCRLHQLKIPASFFLYLFLRPLNPFSNVFVVFELIPRRNVSLLLTVRGYLSDFLKRRSKW